MTDQDRLDRLNVLFKMHDLKLHCEMFSSSNNAVFRIKISAYNSSVFREFKKISDIEKYSHGLIKQSIKDFVGYKNRIDNWRVGIG